MAEPDLSDRSVIGTCETGSSGAGRRGSRRRWRSIGDALRGSTHRVRRHWWHTGAVAGTFWLLSQIPGPALGFALLFTTIPITTVNLIGSVVFALTIPYVGIGRTLLYLDLGARKETRAVTGPAVLRAAPTT